MNDLDKLVRLTQLFDRYNSLLTQKQKDYFTDYYFDNSSLAEVAEKYNVSRNAIYSQLNLLEVELEDFESKLHLLEKDEKRNKLLEQLKNMNNDEVNSIVKQIEEVDE